jgi:CRP-like cAMP-binding protein
MAGWWGAGTALGFAGAAIAITVVVGAVLLGPAAIQRPHLDPAREQLVAAPALAGLPPARLEAAAADSFVAHVRAGEVIIRQGDPADRFYVIADGSVAVSQATDGAAPVELRRMGRGEVFGEIGLLSGVPRTATVTAVDDTTLVSLDGRQFLELVGAAPDLSSRLLELHRGAVG